jgi:flagellar hook assembly protein FlgD
LLNLDRNETQVTVSIHDASGRLMNSHNVNSVRAGSIVGLDIDGLANGVYQVTVEGNNFKNVGRLTISK